MHLLWVCITVCDYFWGPQMHFPKAYIKLIFGNVKQLYKKHNDTNNII